MPGAAVVRPGVQVAAGGGDAGVAERRLHQADRRPVVERVRSMGVPQPMGADRAGQAGTAGGALDDSVHRRLVEVAAAAAGAEHRRVRRGGAAQRRHRAPHRGRQQDRAGPAALAEDRQLPGVAAGLQVAPGEAAELGDAQPGRIEQAQHRRVARVGLAVE